MNIADSLIDSPAAWLGVEQRNRNDWIYLLSDAEKGELDFGIRAYQAMRRPLSEIGKAYYPLLVPGLAVQRWMLEIDAGRGFILVGGFPVASYSEEDAAFAYRLMGHHMGRNPFKDRDARVRRGIRTQKAS